MAKFAPHPFPKWIVVILLFLTPFIGLFDVVFGGVAVASLFVEETGEVQEEFVQRDTADERDPAGATLTTEGEGFMIIPLFLLTPFNAALLLLWSAAITMVRRRWWIARQLERADVESAPPGCELLADGPNIRLRATNVTALTAGLIGAGATGFVLTFGSVALMLLFGLEGSVVLALLGTLMVLGTLVPWYWRRRVIESGRYDLVVDRAARMLAWDGGDPAGPNARSFDDIQRVEIEKKVTTSRSSDGKSSTQTDYIVWLHEKRGRQELYRFGNEPTKADAVGLWLHHLLGHRLS